MSQIELAAEQGMPQRMVAYDESPAAALLDNLLPQTAIEKLDVAERRQVFQVLAAFIERGQLKRKAENRA